MRPHIRKQGWDFQSDVDEVLDRLYEAESARGRGR